jgi:hypothetical protein
MGETMKLIFFSSLLSSISVNVSGCFLTWAAGVAGAAGAAGAAEAATVVAFIVDILYSIFRCII